MTITPITTLPAAVALCMMLAACNDNEGPFERAGEAIDESLNDAGRALEDAAD